MLLVVGKGSAHAVTHTSAINVSYQDCQYSGVLVTSHRCADLILGSLANGRVTVEPIELRFTGRLADGGDHDSPILLSYSRFLYERRSAASL